MTGGLLELYAKGKHDIYLTKDPNITFFKTIYRRHTNFSKVEMDLKFTNKMDFGREGYCLVENYGDMLHRLFLVLKLPRIDLFFKSLTISQVKELLDKYDIYWETNKDTHLQFDHHDLNSIINIVNIKMEKYKKELNIIEKMKEFVNVNNNFDLDDIINKNMMYSENNLEYQLINAHIEDIKLRQLPIANSIDIKNMIVNHLMNYITGKHTNYYSYNGENIEFLYNITTANCHITSLYDKMNSKSIMEKAIFDIYQDKKYKYLDAYKIYLSFINDTNMIIEDNIGIQNIKSLTGSKIKRGLVDNIKIIKNIYSTIDNNVSFIFYKKYYDINSTQFNNLSIDHFNKAFFSDNLTNIFNNKHNHEFDNSNPLFRMVTTEINNFHIKNQNLFRDTKLSEYFDDISLWNTLDMNNDNMYYLNNIWIKMNQDIFDLINNIKFDISDIEDNDYKKLLQELEKIKNVIQEKIKIKINNKSHIDNKNLEILSDKIKYNGSMLFTIIKPGKDNMIIKDDKIFTISEFITESYLQLIKEFEGKITGDVNKYQKIIMPQIKNIINLFISNYDDIPNYKEYTMKQTNAYNDVLNNIHNYSFVQCSIWNYIFNKIKDNYNDLYNNILLSYDKYLENIGIEAVQYLNDISQNYFDYYIGKNTFFDYFKLSKSINIKGIKNYLTKKEIKLKDSIQFFDDNKELLNSKDIILPKSEFYFEEYNKIVDYIINKIEHDPNIFNHNLESKKIIHILKKIMMNKKDEYIIPKNTISDIINKLKASVQLFFSSNNNPFDSIKDPNKSKLFNNYSTNEKNIYQNKIINIIDNNNKKIFDFKTKILSSYNNFISESDYYNYINDIIINNEILLPNMEIQKLRELDDIKNVLLNYYNEREKYIKNSIEKINGSNINISLINLLRKSLNKEARANFAWIKRIGHYIIDQVYIKIGNNIIDKQYGEWMEIWHSLTKSKHKTKGYNNLIGNIKELYKFNNKSKDEHELIIPLQFWFCRNVGLSLPLVALNNTNIRIYVKLKDFDQVCYYDDFTVFKKKPRLSSYIIGEYIYLESEERNKIATSKLEYLIDVVQYNGEILINKSNLNEDNILELYTQFKNPCKELIWMLQPMKYLNEKKKPYLYSYKINKEYVNPLLRAKIKFNSRDRESWKDIEFYNYVKPYEVHTSSPDIGINIYSFALNPEYVQPTGSVNLSMIDNLIINMEFKKDVLEDLNETNLMFRLPVYSLSINLLVIHFGKSLLVFDQ